jgi:flagellar biogenesis protein FliO
MKREILTKIIVMHLAFFSWAAGGFAKSANTNINTDKNAPPAHENANANANTPVVPLNEVTTENDHLPFMQQEQGAAPQEPTSGSLLIKTLGSMLLIVGLIFFGAWGAKKLGFGGAKAQALEDAPDLAILSSVSLGNSRTISTVRFGDRVLVIGSTPQSFTLLAEEDAVEKISLGNSRSVAEMLADENLSFDDEFERASLFLRERGEEI